MPAMPSSAPERIAVVEGDITALDVDAIVNAAKRHPQHRLSRHFHRRLWLSPGAGDGDRHRRSARGTRPSSGDRAGRLLLLRRRAGLPLPPAPFPMSIAGLSPARIAQLTATEDRR